MGRDKSGPYDVEASPLCLGLMPISADLSALAGYFDILIISLMFIIGPLPSITLLEGDSDQTGTC